MNNTLRERFEEEFTEYDGLWTMKGKYGESTSVDTEDLLSFIESEIELAQKEERERIAERLKRLLPQAEFNLNIHRILEVIHNESVASLIENESRPLKDTTT